MKNLPNWNLDDLYLSPTAKELAFDIELASKKAIELKEKYQGKVANLKGEKLYSLIKEDEKTSEILGKIGTYAYLYFITDMLDEKRSSFFQSCSEKINNISQNLIFVSLEIAGLTDKQIQEKLTNKELQKYTPFIRDIRAGRDYRKSQEIEEILHEKSQTSSSAWSRFFDETIASLKFKLSGTEYSASEIFDFLSSKDGLVRKKAAKAVSKTLGENIRIFSFITNTLAKDKAINDKIRNYPHPVKSRNVANLIEDEVVECLADTVKANYKNLAHRYYKYKASLFGSKSLAYYDRNAPLPESSEEKIPWLDAKDIVLSAYYDFIPEMGKIAEQFFDKNWIDAGPSKGKDSGAFAHPATTDTHPYILLNYQGKKRDVMTLAHELGHGIHQVLSAKQGYFLADTPLTLAETASVFGEQLAFERLLKNCKTESEKNLLLASKIEDQLNTIVRQVAFFEFEKQVHQKRREGELTSDDICKIWLDVQKASLGPSIKMHADYKYFWSYIPHFIHSPFYVYAYAFGNCLVNSLYKTYQDGLSDFKQKYLDMLSAGGTLHHTDLLRPFGLSAKDSDFWQKGLTLVTEYLDTLIKPAS